MSEFWKGMKKFEENYVPPPKRDFKIYYDNITGDINYASDNNVERSNDSESCLIIKSDDLETVKDMLDSSISSYIVKNNKIIKRPSTPKGLYLRQIYSIDDVDFTKDIYCTVKGRPGIIVDTYKTVNKMINFEKYDYYQTR